MNTQDLLSLVNVVILYVADVIYGIYAEKGIARDCCGERACVIRDIQDFLAITALTTLFLSPLYVIPILLSVVWHIHWLLTPALGIIAATVLIGEAVAYLSRYV